jgi:uncharacterized protein (UPF0332 family)
MFEDLLKSRRLRKHHASVDEIRRAIERSHRDLTTAHKIMADDWDWGFAVAYDAVLQASRAYMLSRGYRVGGNEAHKTTFAFMREAMNGNYDELLSYFDRMRMKRNQAIYDIAGLITETEARALLGKATEFVCLVEAELADRIGSGEVADQDD